MDIDIIVSKTGDIANVKALLDTGCTGGIVLTKKDVQKLKIKLAKPINSKPIKCKIADGSAVPTYLHDIIVKFKGEKKPTLLRVIHQDEVYEGEEKDEDKEIIMALLGHEVMKDYQVTFNGLSNPQSYSFAK